MRDHFVLAHQIAAQQAAVDQGQKLRAQLPDLAGKTAELAGKTAELAQSGDAAARNVAVCMEREGVTLHPPKAPSGSTQRLQRSQWSS